MNADQKLKRIAKIYETLRQENGLCASSHARHNLEGALMDMEQTGIADKVCLRTIHRVCRQLGQIEDVLGAYLK